MEADVFSALRPSKEADISKAGTARLRLLGTDGCGMHWILIVNGLERGNVWMAGGEGVTATVPKRDFLTWYENWLTGVDNWFA